MNISTIILKSLIDNDDFLRRSLPFIKEEYFENSGEKKIFEHIHRYSIKYNNPPTVEALLIEMSNDTSITEVVSEQIDESINHIKEKIKPIQTEWILAKTEEFCKERALHNALYEAINIYEGNHKILSKGAIPSLLSDALAVGFDTDIGHDYFENSEDRLDYYLRKEEGILTGISILDNVLQGGFIRKSLNIFLAGTNAGKSQMLCNLAANNIMDNRNVLYITGEMREEEISKRIDANLLDLEMSEFKTISKKLYNDRIAALKARTNGKLKVKEYPTSSANSNHIRLLINELLLKKKFAPDIIYLDYLNIFTSLRFKGGNVTNTNTYYKAVSEEFRGLAIEFNLPIVSAGQLNRTGSTNSDPGLDDISESFGTAMTADWIAAIISIPELAEKNMTLIKQLKSRYDNKDRIPMFMLGVDRQKMRFYDLDDPFQDLSQQPQNTSSILSSNKKKFGSFN